jgi:hypothetical protein
MNAGNLNVLFGAYFTDNAYGWSVDPAGQPAVDALLAAELRTVVSVQIFAGDTPVSCTLQYSADTYGNNKTGKLLELCKALFAYSNSAKNYFA